jgi:hypothetical protein
VACLQKIPALVYGEQSDQGECVKNRPKCSQKYFVKITQYTPITVEKKLLESMCHFRNVQKKVQGKQSPNRQKFAQSGYPDGEQFNFRAGLRCHGHSEKCFCNTI